MQVEEEAGTVRDSDSQEKVIFSHKSETWAKF